MFNITIHMASDHAGFALKEDCKAFLLKTGYTIVDHGSYVLEADDDFPDFISRAAAAVSAAPETSKAFIFGGSGQGEAMLANRFPKVRATVYYGGSREIITLSRQHNDANVLSFGARFVATAEAVAAITTWLETPALLDPKYRRRNQKIETISRAPKTL